VSETVENRRRHEFLDRHVEERDRERERVEDSQLLLLFFQPNHISCRQFRILQVAICCLFPPCYLFLFFSLLSLVHFVVVVVFVTSEPPTSKIVVMIPPLTFLDFVSVCLVHQYVSSDCVLALSIGGGLSHNASSCGATTGSIRQQPCREDNTTTSSLHSTVPSALIHHHPPPPSSNPSTPSSSNSYPSSHPNSPGYHLGMGNAGQPYQQQQQQQQQGGGGAGGNRGNASSAAAASVYSAKVLAFQQGSNRQAPPASMGLSSGNSSQSSRPPSADDSADSFFHFDSISSHQQPYQHPHHLSFPPPGPLHPSELQLAGKHILSATQKKKSPPCIFIFFLTQS
jgi:hypothetical protein